MTQEIIININQLAGDFAENKDLAKKIRLEKLIPAIGNKKDVIINFQGVNFTTQSFIHALISDVIRKYGIDVIDNIIFKSCNDEVMAIINIVIDYMQDFTLEE